MPAGRRSAGARHRPRAGDRGRRPARHDLRHLRPVAARSESRPGPGGPTCRSRTATGCSSPRAGAPTGRGSTIAASSSTTRIRRCSAGRRQTFGGFNHRFYEHVFELILRLRGNLLWPAMWGKSFYEDDPENARLANEMGVVIGTSHHEPMMRAQVEWERHGQGPVGLHEERRAAARLLARGHRAHEAQREHRHDRHARRRRRADDRGHGDAAAREDRRRPAQDHRGGHASPRRARRRRSGRSTKRCRTITTQGMRVPDDVTLLFSDDNWGNLRRLPAPGAQARRRLRHLLSLRLCRRPAQLQVAQHQPDRASLGADAPRLRARRATGSGSSMSATQADGVSDQLLSR